MIPTSVTFGKCRPFAIICVPTRISILPARKASQRFAIRIFARHRIGIHPPDDCLRKNLRDVGFHFFGPESGVDERVLAAGRAFFRNGRGVSAQMATQPRSTAMKSERDAAIRAIARFAAITAKQ